MIGNRESEKQMTTVFNHMGLSVQDIDGEVAFYTEAFGLVEEFRFEIEAEGVRAVVLRSPDGWGIEIISRAGSEARPRYDTPHANLLTQGYGHFCLRVDDIHARHERLVGLGAREITPPAPGPHPAVTFSYLADPEGHFFELIQYSEGAGL
jgi:catechol 2,3-dioxygenase-like lactoylglutathione lyase family enzyme